MVVVLAVKFWVVVPKNLRNTTECLSAWCEGGRAMRPYGKVDGAGLYLGPGRVTDTKQNCPCYEHLDRKCSLQKDQGPQDRIHSPKIEFHTNFALRVGPPKTPPSNPPRPPLLRGRLASIQNRFDIDAKSKQGQIRKSMSNQCRIDVNRYQIDP